MPTIRALDNKLVEQLFEMQGGYVLDFVDRTFASFFADELGVDIGAPLYRQMGDSKAKRLRCYLIKTDGAAAARALEALWAYREASRLDAGRVEWVAEAESRFRSMLDRVRGVSSVGAEPQASRPSLDTSKGAALKQRLVELSSLQPQPRGYAFELWLRDAFDAFGLQAREPFRLRGEQIDGSFVLGGDTYLVEAKWEAAKTGVTDLHAFHGKIEQKAIWARGLFVSNTGFTDEGLAAFGKGKRVICMDGLDLFDMLDRQLPLDEMLALKARRAAETGLPFVRVRDL